MIAVLLGLSISSYLLLALIYFHNRTYSLSPFYNLPLDDFTTLKTTSAFVSISSKYSLGTSGYCWLIWMLSGRIWILPLDYLKELWIPPNDLNTLWNNLNTLNTSLELLNTWFDSECLEYLFWISVSLSLKINLNLDLSEYYLLSLNLCHWIWIWISTFLNTSFWIWNSTTEDKSES